MVHMKNNVIINVTLNLVFLKYTTGSFSYLPYFHPTSFSVLLFSLGAFSL
jgi:hypothetical protein